MQSKFVTLMAAGLGCCMAIPVASAEQVLAQAAPPARATPSAAVVRVMSPGELQALKKYCKRDSNRKDRRCLEMAWLEAGKRKSGSISPWLIGVPLVLGGALAAAGGGGGGGAPASP